MFIFARQKLEAVFELVICCHVFVYLSHSQIIMKLLQSCGFPVYKIFSCILESLLVRFFQRIHLFRLHVVFEK